MTLTPINTYKNLLNSNLEWALQEGSICFEGDNAVHKTLRRIAERLDELDVDYAICFSIYGMTYRKLL